LKNENPHFPEIKFPLTVAEFSKELRLSPITVYRKLKQGDLPCHRLGDRYLIFEDDWIELLRRTKIGKRDSLSRVRP
jgi:excisionase family DNA binding protein